MAYVKTTINRRSFIRSSVLAGGGMLLGFNWMAACASGTSKVLKMSEEWFRINAFLKLGVNGVATIMSPNPEIGQNVKTSMPMIVAEELDINWDNVLVEQARLNTDLFKRQLAGGSQSIRQGWNGLRLAGATARRMLMEAAAQKWNVPVDEITTDMGVLYHKKSGNKAGYGEMASAAAKIKVPGKVKLKDIKDFKIIGTSRKNVDAPGIVTGKPLFGLDHKKEGMLIAMIVHPPAFGLKLKSFDDTEARSMPGIKDIFSLQTYNEGYRKQWSDTDAFNDLVAVVGNSTWEVINAKDALKVEWEPIQDSPEVPSRRESTDSYKSMMAAMDAKPGNVRRKDGDPEAAFKKAAKVIERTYSAPFLAHNTMEPMNFFADVTDNKAEMIGPVQSPEFMEKSVAARLGMPLEKVDVQMTRAGGGFGRRLYGHFMVEAAVISQKMKAPVKLIYKREDDMTFGNYRPAYHAYYRAGLDAGNNLVAFHVRAGGMSESPLEANRFPAGAVDNYLAEEWVINTNITTAAFRAPSSNFIASAEQSFLDEVAEAAGKDPAVPPRSS
ncbi:MAG TPA: molybdopterin cofactor-binding domain-containing protein, partial [Bacteroidales bacterium]|nr:molybdopterin cofactor-binding domain-containing protein [Bacteroidales bacterium]